MEMNEKKMRKFYCARKFLSVNKVETFKLNSLREKKDEIKIMNFWRVTSSKWILLTFWKTKIKVCKKNSQKQTKRE